VFDVMANVTLPLPAPDDPAWTLIQGALLVADHAHPLAAVTATAPGPPVAATAWVRGLIAYEHAGTPVDCAIVIV
jgi:hypothetical protein